MHGGLEDKPPNIKRRSIREGRSDNLDKILAVVNVVNVSTRILPDGIENGIQGGGTNAKEHEDANSTISATPTTPARTLTHLHTRNL